MRRCHTPATNISTCQCRPANDSSRPSCCLPRGRACFLCVLNDGHWWGRGVVGGAMMWWRCQSTNMCKHAHTYTHKHTHTHTHTCTHTHLIGVIQSRHSTANILIRSVVTVGVVTWHILPNTTPKKWLEFNHMTFRSEHVVWCLLVDDIVCIK